MIVSRNARIHFLHSKRTAHHSPNISTRTRITQSSVKNAPIATPTRILISGLLNVNPVQTIFVQIAYPESNATPVKIKYAMTAIILAFAHYVNSKHARPVISIPPVQNVAIGYVKNATNMEQNIVMIVKNIIV